MNLSEIKNIIENSSVKTWFGKLQNIWLAKDIEGVKNLLSEEFEYHEDPFESPLTSWPEVEKAWEEIKNQDISKLEINVLMNKEDEGFATYELVYKDSQRKDHYSKGVYYVKLDSNGKAVEFRQWWVSK